MMFGKEINNKTFQNARMLTAVYDFDAKFQVECKISNHQPRRGETPIG